MSEMSKISVLIPVYNEADTIGRVIERTLRAAGDAIKRA